MERYGWRDDENVWSVEAGEGFPKHGAMCV